MKGGLVGEDAIGAAWWNFSAGEGDVRAREVEVVGRVNCGEKRQKEGEDAGKGKHFEIGYG